MRRHIAYARYLIRHKWFVFVAGIKTGAPLWRLVIHDWSKLTPSEWLAYARTFYAPDGSKQYKPDAAFDRAWLHHQHKNPHHWQHWLLRLDTGENKAIEIPEKFVREMVADWMGAGRAIKGRWEVAEWYQEHMPHSLLHPNTRKRVEQLIASVIKDTTQCN